MHEHKSKCDRFGDFMGQKHDQGSICLPQTAAGLVLRSLDLAAPLELLIVYRTKHTHASKQVQTVRNSTPNNKNSTKRGY